MADLAKQREEYQEEHQKCVAEIQRLTQAAFRLQGAMAHIDRQLKEEKDAAPAPSGRKRRV